jgi:uncharacterized membrane protein YfcA
MRVSPVFVWYVTVPGLFVLAVASGIVPATAETFAVLLLCAMLEFVDSSLGMGYGTTLTPVLLLLGFEPLDLVPTILVSEFLSGFASSFFHSEAGNVRFVPGSNHLRAAVILSACSIAGVAAGVNLAVGVSTVVLKRVIGFVILGAGLYILAMASRTFHFNYVRIVLLALVASFNKAISGGGYGPLMTSGQVMSGIRGRAAVAITSLAEGFTCLIGTTLFLVAGKTITPSLLIAVVTGALLAVPLSARAVRRFREEHMKRTIAILTIALGALTVVKTF